MVRKCSVPFRSVSCVCVIFALAASQWVVHVTTTTRNECKNTSPCGLFLSGNMTFFTTEHNYHQQRPQQQQNNKIGTKAIKSLNSGCQAHGLNERDVPVITGTYVFTEPAFVRRGTPKRSPFHHVSQALWRSSSPFPTLAKPGPRHLPQ